MIEDESGVAGRGATAAAAVEAAAAEGGVNATFYTISQLLWTTLGVEHTTRGREEDEEREREREAQPSPAGLGVT